jgi:curved DNA-binding protein CbpA
MNVLTKPPRRPKASRRRSSRSSAAAVFKGPPPPPPPIPFDPIIARVYGPTINIYKGIFKVSPDADQEEIYKAYNWVRTEEQLQLDNLAIDYLKNPSEDKAQLKMRIMLQRDATYAAYQVVINAQKRKQYDKAISLVVAEQLAVITSSAEKKKKEPPGRKEYVTDTFEVNDLQPSPDQTVSTRKQIKLPVVSPNKHDLYGPADSPTAVSEFDESRKAVDDDVEASYDASLGKPSSGRRKKSLRSSRSSREKSSRREREDKKKAAIDTYYEDIYDSDVSKSFANDEVPSNADACIDIIASYMSSACPCVNISNVDDDDSIYY